MKSPNQEQARGIATILIVIVAVVLAVILFKKITGFFGGITDKIGLTDSKEEKDLKETVKSRVSQETNKADESPWSPAYLAAVKSTAEAKAGEKIWKPGALLKQSITDDLAIQVFSSIGIVYDDPEQVSGAIKKCKSKVQISFLAKVFQDIYKKDLLTFLQDRLDTYSQKLVLKGILDYVEKLPSGITVKK